MKNQKTINFLPLEELLKDFDISDYEIPSHDRRGIYSEAYRGNVLFRQLNKLAFENKSTIEREVSKAVYSYLKLSDCDIESKNTIVDNQEREIVYYDDIDVFIYDKCEINTFKNLGFFVTLNDIYEAFLSFNPNSKIKQKSFIKEVIRKVACVDRSVTRLSIDDKERRQYRILKNIRLK